MKTKNSSSSFMIGIAKLPNVKVIKKAKEYKSLFPDEVMVGTISEIMKGDPDNMYFRQDQIVIEDNYSEVEVYADLDPEVIYIVVSMNNNEGDDAFMKKEGSPLDYEIDLDFFSKQQQQLFLFIRELKDSDIEFGAR
jgi:hypothetical protein